MDLLTTRDVCRILNLTEPALRHVLRRPGAPRPPLHPSARLFLWAPDDLARLIDFLGSGTHSSTNSPKVPT